MIGVKKNNRMRNKRIRELVSVCKRVDNKVIFESTMSWYGHTQK